MRSMLKIFKIPMIWHLSWLGGALTALSIYIHGRYSGLNPTYYDVGTYFLISIFIISTIVYLLKTMEERENVLKASDEQYKSLFENSPDAIFTVDIFGKFITSNDACYTLSGYSRREADGLLFTEFLPSREVPKVMGIFKDVLNGRSIHFQSELMHKSGRRIHIDVTAVPAIMDGKLIGAYGIVKDITERIEKENALLESEERYSALFQYNPNAVFTINKDGKFVSVNPAAVGIGGYSVEETKAMPSFRNVLMPGEIPINEKYFRLALSGKATRYETAIINKKGDIVPLEITAVPIFVGQKVVGIHGIAKDITELKNNEMLQKNYSRMLVENQEIERKRIAAELHDGLGQNLIVISNGLKQCIAGKMDQEVGVGKMREMAILAEQSVVDVGKISFNLHPHILDKLGLKFAIESVIKEITKMSGIEINHDIADITGKVSKEIETNIFRIMQEAMSNIVKHSGADKAEISLVSSRSGLEIRISDNGAKHGEKELPGNISTSGFGLMNIRERVRIMRGEMAVDAKDGSGWTIDIKLPAVG